ncbi:MAG TPA: UbiA family prenyltransferase [Dehalococcoidia bacterium]
MEWPLGARTRALLALAHPGPSAATVLVALLFMVLLARGRPPGDKLAPVALMLSCQQVAISLHNDYCDRALDAAAKPWRAVPSGAASARGVLAGAWLLAALSLAFAVLVNWTEALLDLIGLAAGFGYNASLKRTALSWLPFAIAFPLLPIFGAVALGSPLLSPWVVAGCFAAGAPIAVAIHLADTLPDLTSDLHAGVRGVAHRLGARWSRRLCLALFVLGGTALCVLAALVRQRSLLA